MAPPRLPTALKILKGTLRQCRESDVEPMDHIPLVKTPPACLAPDEKAAWREMHRISIPGVLKESDRVPAEIYCQLRAKMLRKEELTPTDYSHLFLILNAFGMTPVARSRIAVRKQPKKDDDNIEQFLANG